MKKSLTASEILLVAFIVLKLCHVISWSWWWVLSPLWISVVLVVVWIVADALIQSDDDLSWRFK